MTIAADSQNLVVGEKIELFAIDASDLVSDTGVTGGRFYFTQAANVSSMVGWRNVDSIRQDGDPDVDWTNYIPIDITASGFEVSGQGTLPRPTLKISNTQASLIVDVIDFRDLLGAYVYRWVTLKKYLR